MSKCSFLCNEIRKKLDNISGLDDEVVFLLLLSIGSTLDAIETYADENQLNGTVFKGVISHENNKKNILEDI